ncbi:MULTISPECIES: DUF5996 family protein [Phenylobacterium]|uniref:Ava_C0101 and related proteins n=1 Tax=Phenylobacterium koreense TaxID=266125 RepID=A0ABV2EGG0_9CAUL
MASAVSDLWPRLDYAKDHGTFETLHLMTQVVGKARTACAPWINHGWQVALYVSPRGFTTSSVPHGRDVFDLEFDFIDQVLRCRASNGFAGTIPLGGQTIAGFYDGVSGLLADAGLPVRIDGRPNEIEGAILFRSDVADRPYDPDAAFHLWRALIQIAQVFESFRTGFLGKISPVHLFWGSFDLAVTRFSGRPAPLHPGGIPNLPDAVAREAYSHEVSSAGFWPGGGAIDYPAFYSYAYPEPEGFRGRLVEPPAAFFHEGLGEFVLSYEAVRSAPDPAAALMAFLSSTYAAAADAGHWPRAELECDFGRPGEPRALQR